MCRSNNVTFYRRGDLLNVLEKKKVNPLRLTESADRRPSNPCLPDRRIRVCRTVARRIRVCRTVALTPGSCNRARRVERNSNTSSSPLPLPPLLPSLLGNGNSDRTRHRARTTITRRTITRRHKNKSARAPR